jgi:hypothetical protein
MRSLDSLRKLVAKLQDANFEQPCRCIIEFGPELPPVDLDAPVCDRCGKPRRDEHFPVRIQVVESRVSSA